MGNNYFNNDYYGMNTRSRTKMGDNDDLRQIVVNIQNNMVTKEQIDELIKRLDEKDGKIAYLEGKVEALENKIEALEKKSSLLERVIDDGESYGRRKNLRIIGIPPPDPKVKETAAQCTTKAIEAIEALDIPDFDVGQSIDRCHRVGKRYTDGTGRSVHPVIIRFKSWQSRTAVYKGRKKMAG